MESPLRRLTHHEDAWLKNVPQYVNSEDLFIDAAMIALLAMDDEDVAADAPRPAVAAHAAKLAESHSWLRKQAQPEA